MDFLRKYRFYLLIFFAAFIQYANTLEHEYAWDDSIVITQNERVQKGIKGIPQLFYKHKSLKAQDKYGYRPLTLISFAIEVGLFGQNPKAGHFFNVLYYCLLCLLLFGTMKEIFRGKGDLFAFVITLVFIVHPLHVEVVANIKSRDEILSLLFGLFALNAFIALFREDAFFNRVWDKLSFISKKLSPERKPIVYKLLNVIFSSLFVVMAFLSKESGIIYLGPMLLFLVYEYGWTLNISIPKKYLLWGAGGMLGVVLVFFAVRQLSHTELYVDEISHMISEDVSRNTWFLGNPLTAAEIPLRLANAPWLSTLYLKNFFVTYPLIHDHGVSIVPTYEWGDWQVWLTLLLHLVLLGYGLWGIKKENRHPEAFGVLWYLGTIFVFLHVVEPGPDIIADRFMFGPSIGVAIVLVGLLSRLLKVDFVKEKGFLKSNAVFTGAMVVILLFFSFRTFSRNKDWKNNLTLFAADMPKLENCARFHYNYGLDLHYKMYESPERDKPRLQKEVLNHYRRAIEISDSSYLAYLDLGAALMEFGQAQSAIKVFNKANELYPRYGNPKFQLGKYYMSIEEYEKAIPLLEKAMEIAPDFPVNYSYLAVAYLKTGVYWRAQEVAEKGRNIEPSPEYFSLASDIWFVAGCPDESSQWLEDAIGRWPNRPDLYQKMIQVYTTFDEVEKAQYWQQQATQRFGQ